MRILVASDTHRRWAALERALRSQPTAEAVIFLGDGEYDVDMVRYVFPEKSIHMVCGNCDFGSSLPACDTLSIGGHTIFFTHGHMYGVKGGTGALEKSAREHGADICLFGHTHVAMTAYHDGLYIMNPGSLGSPRSGNTPSYGIIDITPGGIMTIICEL